MECLPRLALVSLLLCGLGCGGGTPGSGDFAEGAGGDGQGDAAGPSDSSGFALPDTGSGCTKRTCAEAGKNCGPIGDNCGGLLDCGACAAPEVCGGGGKPSVCGTSTCTPKTCADLGVSCGKQGDGCGGLIECGTCAAPATCGGGGVPSVCGAPGRADAGGGADGASCTPKKCATMGYTCGPVADGCGALVDCGVCATGVCGGGGSPNVCGGGSGATCVKKTCADWGADCGPVSDGCGGLTASCGTCAAPAVCGGGGVPSVCGSASATCVKKTCADYPGTCGPQPDGCGGLTPSCGTCLAPATCGGGGVPSVCGGGAAACAKKTCADYAGTCGPQPDGCGGLTESCGTCTAPASCGGGGVASVCGGGPSACVKKTCADFPAGTCGPVSDGCGGLTASCGTCASPAICGGGGVPSQCGGGGGTRCVNLACKQIACPGAGTTSISGVVYDPAGLRGLPNVFVYVPNDTVGAFPPGASCDKCSAALSGAPLVTTTTDVDGRFKLTNMPVDAKVPVVMQIGKWRRQITVTTAQCADTVVLPSLSRLPRNRAEGDIPKIALTTGGADPLECLLRKIGIDDAEFTNPEGSGRVNLFSGLASTSPTRSYQSGVKFPDATQLWDQLDPAPAATPQVYGLRPYDVVLMGCEKTPTTANKSASALSAMQAYVNNGGRVFGEHYHYTWMQSGPAPWPGMVRWNSRFEPFTNPTQETVLTGFPKGSLMSQWMQVVGAATRSTPSTPSTFPVSDARHSILAVNDTSNVIQWIQAPTARVAGTRTTYTNATQYFSFNTPVAAPADSVCGRFVFSDIHVASGDSTGVPFPGGCTTSTMTPQELALEFMFFDLASRVCSETAPPPPPTCTPRSCSDQGITCGPAPDGCGGTIASCGTCAPPYVCGTGGACGGSSCTPTTCPALGHDCGSWPDGCGGTLTCGACTAPATCGGSGIPGTCGGASCTPTTCSALGRDCGAWPDGCGGTLTCGTCAAPATCGGSGLSGKCGGASCTPKTCGSLGYACGSWADGCGGSVSCGICAAPATCGGGGVPGACGSAGTCTPRTCAAMGVTCGPSGDGCGGTLDCGPCAGAGGDAGAGCSPLTCGGRCGPQGDGCGGVLSCPACEGGACVKTTCGAAGAECGSYPDGCGGLLECGTCAAGSTCGGGGPNKCGAIR